ncbi:hypothetical protein LTR78_005483 [Recurvomyces mirabilis]|uniref:AB hydrolase-1 domain-containing protein n=1 Tax=Recurvomyces mirabilis TaxID=574656 RepID=A0AAE0WN53_9PEZI|nr:hypothetical protein LTR78_005483 [Recurvomyces mirabilis]KAK5152608.1 hypothetical protein LTS14_008142 [Recurvomyces mirabilis]
MARPTIIIIIPGSWHTAEHAQPTVHALRRNGYIAKADQLASVGLKERRQYFADDVAHLHGLVVDELDAGRDVCFVLHSYAGQSGAETINRVIHEGRLEASAGKGRLVQAVFVAAYAFPAGVALDSRNFLGPENPNFGIDDERHLNTMTDPERVFCLLLKQNAYYQDATPVITSEDWRKAPITVVATKQDITIPPARQEMVWQGFALNWIDAGHVPFISQPDAVADIIIGALS